MKQNMPNKNLNSFISKNFTVFKAQTGVNNKFREKVFKKELKARFAKHCDIRQKRYLV